MSENKANGLDSFSHKIDDTYSTPKLLFYH